MPLSLVHVFRVESPPDEVWAYLTDPIRVAPDFPGASVTARIDGSTFSGTFAATVGAVTATYGGTAYFEEMDPEARSVLLVAAGRETSGHGRAELRLKGGLVETESGGTEVTVVSEIELEGAISQLGRKVLQDASNQVFQRFVAAVKRELERGDDEGSPTMHLSPEEVASLVPRTTPAASRSRGSAPVARRDPPPSAAAPPVRESPRTRSAGGPHEMPVIQEPEGTGSDLTSWGPVPQASAETDREAQDVTLWARIPEPSTEPEGRAPDDVTIWTQAPPRTSESGAPSDPNEAPGSGGGMLARVLRQPKFWIVVALATAALVALLVR